MNRAKLRAVLVERLGENLPCAQPELRFRCPRCHQRGKTADLSGHLHVNPEVEKFNCFRCEWRGPLSALLRLYGISSLVTVADWETTVRSMSVLSGRVYEAASYDATAETPYPCEVVHPSVLPEAWRYLTSPKDEGGRGLSREIIDYYRIVAAFDQPYLGRVMIPTLHAGTVVYWVARTYCDQTPKYMNPKDVSKKYYLFGLEQAKAFPAVVITEGVFSAIAAGPNAVATFGKSVSTEQKKLLLDAKFSQYVVALDGDARKEAVALARWFASRGADTYLVDMPADKDPDEDPDFRKRVESAKKFDFYSTAMSSLDTIR